MANDRFGLPYCHHHHHHHHHHHRYQQQQQQQQQQYSPRRHFSETSQWSRFSRGKMTRGDSNTGCQGTRTKSEAEWIVIEVKGLYGNAGKRMPTTSLTLFLTTRRSTLQNTI
jgi:hypothetical protein